MELNEGLKPLDMPASDAIIVGGTTLSQPRAQLPDQVQYLQAGQP